MTVNCPCSIFGLAQTPFTPSSGDTGAVEVGVKFSSQVSGWITGVRFYKGAGNTGTHVGNLWTATGQLLASAVFVNETSNGWQEADFGVPVPVTAGTTYVASYFAPNGDYAADNLAADYASPDEGLDQGAGAGPVQALPDGSSGGNGVFHYGSDVFPTSTFGATNYWVDPVLDTVLPPDTTPPVVTSTTPLDGATSVPVSSAPTAVFDEPVQPSTISFTLTDPGNTSVPGTTSYDAGLDTATFTPTSALAAGTVYTATVSGEVDLAGNVQTIAKQWSFTTAVDTESARGLPVQRVERLDGAGHRHRERPPRRRARRPLPRGQGRPHRRDPLLQGSVEHRGPHREPVDLERSAAGHGDLLERIDHGVADRDLPVAGRRQRRNDLRRVVPHQHGQLLRDARSVRRPGGRQPAPARSGRRQPDRPGRRVHATAPAAFPSNPSGGANYFVDVVFTPGPDTTPPTVAATSPSPGTTSVQTTASVTATMSESIQAASANETLTGPGGAVAGTVSYSPSTLGITFTPSAPLDTGHRLHGDASTARST